MWRLWILPVAVGVILAGVLFVGVVARFGVSDANDASDTSVAAEVATTPQVQIAPVPSPETTTPPNTAPQTTAPQASEARAEWLVPWMEEYRDLFEETIEEAANLEWSFDGRNAAFVESVRRISENMYTLAESLEGENEPSAVASRVAFETCGKAYGDFADLMEKLQDPSDLPEGYLDELTVIDEAIGECVDSTAILVEILG